MAIAKVILNGETLMDVTSDTATANNMLSGTKATKNDGTKVTGNIASKSSSDLTASGATVTAPAGYYSANASKTVASGSAKTPATTITANPSVSIDSDGLITATVSGSKSVTPTVSVGYVSSGTAGTVSVSGSGTKQLTKRTSTDLTVSGATVTAPSGYYPSSVNKSVATATHPNPTASIDYSTGVVTASHTQGTGYVTESTTTGTLSLPTQEAQTITPSTSVQTIAANKWLTGAQTIGAIPSDYKISKDYTIRILGSNDYCKITVPGQASLQKFTTGDVYSANEGETISIRVTDGGSIYIDGHRMKTDNGRTVNYSFTMPACHLDINCGIDALNLPAAYIHKLESAKVYNVVLGTMPNKWDNAHVHKAPYDSTENQASHTGDTIGFYEGEEVYTYISYNNSKIYYNKQLVDAGDYRSSYTFPMPKSDVEISVDSSNARMDITSTPMITINRNGYVGVDGYGIANVQVPHTYTARLINHSGHESLNYVLFSGTKYYALGSSFSFVEGDVATFYGDYGDGPNEIYVDGTLISNDTSYDYTLPACNIEIDLQNYNTPTSQYSVQKIIRPILTITTNGTYDVYDYARVIVNVS